MAMKLEEIEGIGKAFAAKLEAAGVKSIEGLLEQGATRRGRDEIATKSGLSGTLILEWVNHADLMRVKGVGSEYADLLEAAGVDSLPELAKRSPANLTARLEAVNAEKKLVRRVPTEGEVTEWVRQAQSLPRVVMH
jgi:predicted flap endonuclease-1-like 5' DNA nuclease